MSAVKTAEPTYFYGYGAKVRRFAESRIVQTKGEWAGQPLKLEKWQRELLDELYLVDENRNYVYREALVGVPRKNGKSTLAAAIALYGLMASGEQGAEVYAAAAARDQARIVFDQARDFVEASPKLRDYLQPMRNAILCPANNGVFRVLSSDAPLQHGLNPSLVVIDELWAHRDPELYYALTTGQLARKNPMVVSITTAGWDRESICWQVYEHGRELAEKGQDAMRKAAFLFRWYESPPGRKVTDKRGWQAANPSSWITNDLLVREVDRLPEFVFRRLHLNQWTDTEEAWISPDWWDACAGEPKIKKGEATWTGIDIGLRRDARAMIWVQWHGDDLHIGHEIAVPKPDKPLSSAEARTRVKKHAARQEGLREVDYDPWQFHESAEILADEGLPMVEYQQSNANMAPASERLYELIREGRVVHDGDPQLRQQVLNAVAAETDRGWRISKRKSKARIDACVALAMAADRAILARDEGPSDIIIF